MVIYGFSPVIFLVGLGFLATFAFLVREGLRPYDGVRDSSANARALQWVRDGDDEDDVLHRNDIYRSDGATGALACAGIHHWEPVVNVNGVAMVPGSGVDMDGNIYGITSSTGTFATDAATHDWEPAVNINGVAMVPGTGVDVHGDIYGAPSHSSATEYQASYGMDSSSDASSHYDYGGFSGMSGGTGFDH